MENENIKIKIKAGLKLRDPITGNIMDCGRAVNVKRTQFWLRRLQDGDCELVKSEKPKPRKKQMPKKSRSVATPPVEPVLDKKVED